MDELATRPDATPSTYRLAHLTDPRARAVSRPAAASRAGRPRRGRSGGHGIAVARYKNTGAYCAVVAEVEAVHEVRVRRLRLAVDAGLVVNPDGVANQIEGGAIQATSWTLLEQVRFDRTAATSTTGTATRSCGSPRCPRSTVEVSTVPTSRPSAGARRRRAPPRAAIANAVYDALGVPVRGMPFTVDRIVAAMPD